MPPIRSVTQENLGAWIIKCNPKRTSIDPFLSAGAVRTDWCVADNYRSRLIRPGNRVLFWVSAHPLRGIWGDGRVAGNVWTDVGQAHVAIRIPLFAEPLTAGEVAGEPGLQAMEVFRSPQQANPSWVSIGELTLLEPLLRTRRQATSAR